MVSNDCSFANMMVIIPVKNEKKVKPINSTNIMNKYSIVVDPPISP